MCFFLHINKNYKHALTAGLQGFMKELSESMKSLERIRNSTANQETKLR